VAVSAAGSDPAWAGTPRSRLTTGPAAARRAGSASLIRRIPPPAEALSCPGVPSAMTVPWSITAIRPAS
jgi:hypothetical protein